MYIHTYVYIYIYIYIYEGLQHLAHDDGDDRYHLGRVRAQPMKSEPPT